VAKVKKKRVSWTPAIDADIVKHKVYVSEADLELDIYTDDFIIIDMPTCSVLLPDEFPAGTFVGEGNFTVGVSAIDDVGNEGDVAIVASPFDFIAPGVPTNLIVENA
jgi:hypothetical protein